jgi:hypothetical protein
MLVHIEKYVTTMVITNDERIMTSVEQSSDVAGVCKRDAK